VQEGGRGKFDWGLSDYALPLKRKIPLLYPVLDCATSRRKKVMLTEATVFKDRAVADKPESFFCSFK
jgi:hypothetical protein